LHFCDVAHSCDRTTTSHAWQYASADIEDAVQVHARYASVPYGGGHAPESGLPPGDIGAINRLLSIGVLVLAGLSCLFPLPWLALPPCWSGGAVGGYATTSRLIYFARIDAPVYGAGR
jgi:hypothetical protein